MSSIAFLHELRIFFFQGAVSEQSFVSNAKKSYKNTKNTWKFIEIKFHPGYEDSEVDS